MRGSGGGPKTDKGKAISSRNALKHGITSPHPVIIEGIETEAAWQRFRDGIVASLAPEGDLEHELAERIAFLLWRLRRVRHHETAVLNHQVWNTETNLAVAEAYAQGTLSKGDLPEIDPRKVFGYQQLRIIPDSLSIDRVIRYETHIHRLWLQTQHELEALQARRRGEQTHLARLDISSPPAG